MATGKSKDFFLSRTVSLNLGGANWTSALWAEAVASLSKGVEKVFTLSLPVSRISSPLGSGGASWRLLDWR
jgi:hypothetical protein